ncbi:CatB-related O-acetyltransferase [Yoonia sp. 208BN28-4]|uniref:CatB-related O-acetyltransferase n=1 Tax=Yoonia sp. 208BN28-4 TaxID=3126505 RepID=UPI0030EEDC3D
MAEKDKPTPKNYFSSESRIEKSASFEAPVRTYGSVKIRKKVEVGHFTFINTRTTLHTGTKMGRFCSIGKNIEIGPFDHPMERLSTSPVSYNAHLHFPDEQDQFIKNKPKRKPGAVIGHDVWIGTNAMILRGVTIGTGAVVGAGSIVTRDVAPYAIVAGTPAKEIRKRFDDKTIKRLMASKWWEQPVSVLGKLDFADIEACLDALEAL